MKFTAFTLTFLLSFQLIAQHQGFKFRFDDNSPIIENGDTLLNAWAGGLDAPQFNTIDMNNDGIEDLALFDQSFGRMVIFISDGQNYHYAMEYSATFPKGFNAPYGWVIMRDANCDGRKDLYTKAPTGVQVFRNLNGPVNYPVWAVFDSAINYDNDPGKIVVISEADIPAIEDIDGDGDIDIATFEFAVGGFVEFYRNLSIETVGDCSSTEFERVTRCWGRIHECQTCGKYDINLDSNCLVNGTQNYCVFRHPGLHAGSTTLLIDMDGDNDKDVMFGDIGCSEVSYLENVGSNLFAQFDSAELGFPFNTQKIDFFEFPALFYEDVDMDGQRDLLVTPNTTVNNAGQIDMSKSVHFYKNTGSDSIPNFSYVQDNFLQESILDVGEFSHPVLEDYDADGDLDLFVANKGRVFNGITKARLFYYENTGDVNSPEFTLVDDDFLGLFNRDAEGIRPFFEDLNGDGKKDFCFTWNENSGIDFELYYFPNQAASANAAMQFDTTIISNYTSNLPPIFNRDYAKFYDYNGDGNKDLFLTSSNFPRMKYFQNDGTIQNPVWTEIDSDVGAIGINLGNVQPSFDFLDFDNNGDIDMVYGDRFGTLKLYPDFLSEVNTGNTAVPRLDNIINDTVSPGQPIEFKINEFIKIATGDLNNDSLPDLIIGTKSGGLHLFYNESTPVSGLSTSSMAQNNLKIYPVPSDTRVIVEIENEGILEIHDILGRKLLSKEVDGISDRLEIDISSYEEGLYFLKLKAENGKVYSGKMIKN